MSFKDAADSVRVGGNVLLQLLAAADGVLPNGWGQDTATKATHLAAWIRAEGAPGLFGGAADRVEACEGLGLRGFDSALGPAPGRRIIHRYFYLIGEYMARSLTAYLAKYWYPSVPAEEHGALRVRVYLRGNGWKLWHADANYGKIGETITKRIRRGVNRLWAMVDSTSRAAPGDSSWVHDHLGAGDPKRDVVGQVVNESKSHESVWENWFSYTLVDLTLVDMTGQRSKVSWFKPIPFRTGGEGSVVEFGDVSPGISLSSAEQASSEVLTKLPVSRVGEINDWLRRRGELVGDEQLEYQAPVAAWVWEAVLKGLTKDPGSVDGSEP